MVFERTALDVIFEAGDEGLDRRALVPVISQEVVDAAGALHVWTGFAAQGV